MVGVVGCGVNVAGSIGASEKSASILKITTWGRWMDKDRKNETNHLKQEKTDDHYQLFVMFTGMMVEHV